MVKCCTSFTLLLARVLIAALFIWLGLGKFVAWDAYSTYMASKGMTFVPYFQVLFGAIELICGLSLVLGYKTRLAAAVLILYLIPVTYIFHDFWNLAEGEEKMEQIFVFLSNLAIMGGLLSLVTVGPGSWAIDRKSCSTETCCNKKVE